ncbi:RelA/SpoT family protein [Natronospirillum operosum]|uniref:guanosine-3',5'-bis(diphosphate) 3'-diphosphatase n=1 Tax=Natronospirillum operosum TaxID=2759953 RepID=A0A4Z0W797_9GAMM|nr:RelA/SpoT family protein [Natronospirillum operosum]TGG91350.1 RelA/SpoT family protein [Natronospirillum operosum]
MPTVDALAERLESYLAPEKINRIKRAYYFAEQAHYGQKRASNEPYIIHPLAVANILARMHMDHQSLMAAMLHDVLEDTPMTREAMAVQFGDGVASLVDGVSKLTHLEFEDKRHEMAENFQKMAMAMAKDLRVILVKLADRLHNMRTLAPLKQEKKKRIAQETLDIYAPIAQRLGINDIRIELENLAFAALYPMRARRISSAITKARGNRKEIVEQVETALAKRMTEFSIDGVTVYGREKHLYGIYQKMKEQHKSFRDIMDVYAFRIVTDSVEDCYKALGAVHSLFKPVFKRFKDYIAVPKVNGYQSIHTTVIGFNGIHIEVQIRTRDMDAMANNGIAAHWLYKENDSENPTPAQARARRWINSLLEIQQQANSSIEFIEHVKVDLFPDEIYVFTPKGRIMELPRGATPVDFAYAVHTDVGNSCVGCLVNRKYWPLSQPLESGDSVKIITTKTARPNTAWLNFVVTGKAKSAIRHYLKSVHKEESEDIGRKLLVKALQQFGLSMERVTGAQWDQLLQDLELPSMEVLYQDIGLGTRLGYVVAKRLAQQLDHRAPDGTDQKASPVALKGTEKLILNYARCCSPIPGDPIVGIITKGKGLVIHRENCNNIAEFRGDHQRCVHLEWDDDMGGDFHADLRIIVHSQRGVLANVASTIAHGGSNIETVNMEDKDAVVSQIQVSVNVTNRKHLAQVMRRLRRLQEVVRVYRISR